MMHATHWAVTRPGHLTIYRYLHDGVVGAPGLPDRYIAVHVAFCRVGQASALAIAR
jgi:hypothetical protein